MQAVISPLDIATTGGVQCVRPMPGKLRDVGIEVYYDWQVIVFR